MTRASLALCVGIAVEHAIFLSFSLQVDSTGGNFGTVGWVYARLSEVALSVLQLARLQTYLLFNKAFQERLRKEQKRKRVLGSMM